MTDDLEQLAEWITPLINKLDAAQRRKLMQSVARDMRRSNQQRMRRQTDPDGQRWEPRLRNRSGQIKRQAMFTKIRTARYLKMNTSPDAAAIQWTGRIASIANTHHKGERARVAPGGPMHHYAERRLLGFSRDDHRHITDLIINHLANL